MSKVIIIGGCAGAKVAWDILTSNPDFSKNRCDIHFVENYTKDWGTIKPSILIRFPAEGNPFWFVATGDNVERAAMTRKWSDMAGGSPVNVIHHQSTIAWHASLGNGILVCAQAVIGVGSHIGDGVILNTAATVDHDCLVGDFAQIGPGAHVCGYCDIGERAFIGAGATVIPHIKIGADAVVAAGAVVTEDVPAGQTVYGCPARAKAVAA